MARADNPTPPDQPPADPEVVARAIVLRRLTLAPRTRAELARSLADRQVPEQAAATVLDRFTELGLIDDAQYAASFTESRRQREGWSRRAIAARLRDKGVPRDVADEALERVAAGDEFDTALRVARRTWNRTRHLDRVVRHRRTMGALARRGYGTSVVLDVVRRLEHEEGGDGDVDRDD